MTDCYVYLWTITHGGATRSPSEYRVQMTGVQHVGPHPTAAVVLGGWSPEFGVYAFWDPSRHTHFTPGLPSLQVPRDMLLAANSSGLETRDREVIEGREVVVALSPANLPWYVQFAADRIYGLADDIAYVDTLARGTHQTDDTFVNAGRSGPARQRRRELVQMVRPYRDGAFRAAVLDAYGRRCAVCGTDLRLVDAAHIIPVSDPEGTDTLDNALALCRLHHAAYDTTLVGVLPDYRIAVNEFEVRRLAETNRASGLSEFRKGLLPLIRLPESPSKRPSPERLRKGLIVRQWPKTVAA